MNVYLLSAMPLNSRAPFLYLGSFEEVGQLALVLASIWHLLLIPGGSVFADALRLLFRHIP